MFVNLNTTVSTLRVELRRIWTKPCPDCPALVQATVSTIRPFPVTLYAFVPCGITLFQFQGTHEPPYTVRILLKIPAVTFPQ